MGVVEVVPGLAHREDPERCEVAALVLLRRRLLPEHVADRVDAPCHVVQQHHAEQPGPEQRGEGPTDCAGEGPAEEEGGSEREDRERGKEPADDARVGIVEQFGRVSARPT